MYTPVVLELAAASKNKIEHLLFQKILAAALRRILAPRAGALAPERGEIIISIQSRGSGVGLLEDFSYAAAAANKFSYLSSPCSGALRASTQGAKILRSAAAIIPFSKYEGIPLFQCTYVRWFKEMHSKP